MDQTLSYHMHLVIKSRDNADLKYLKREGPTVKRGKSKNMPGKLTLNKLQDLFSLVLKDQEAIYSLLKNSPKH